jgi:D-alanyl-D-alanine dipeptidase
MDVFQIIKIRNWLQTATNVGLFFLFLPLTGITQKLKTSSYGVKYISSFKSYHKSTEQDSMKSMLELKQLIPTIVYDLRYATENNFVKQPLYPIETKTTFLRLPAALALNNIQKELQTLGLGLKIFDAYRPYSVTVKFWELIKDERYVANPVKGSGHNRGLAVDLTIIDLNTGTELNMGTGFDHFSDTAHHSFTLLPETVLQNRKLLKEIMLKYGFQLFETEWWHYYWPNNKGYEILDLECRKLKNRSN